jgi:hypothetical protein
LITFSAGVIRASWREAPGRSRSFCGSANLEVKSQSGGKNGINAEAVEVVADAVFLCGEIALEAGVRGYRLVIASGCGCQSMGFGITY